MSEIATNISYSNTQEVEAEDKQGVEFRPA